MSKVTVKQAAFLTGLTKETINKATNDGTISHSLNQSNRKVIEIAELQRVYPIVNDLGDMPNGSKSTKSGQAVSESDKTESDSEVSDLKFQIELLKEKLNSSEAKMQMICQERERDLNDIEDLKKKFEKEQELHGNAMKLITDQTGKSESKEKIEKQVQQLDKRVANQERLQQEEKTDLKRKNKKLYRALQEERNKSLWKIFWERRRGSNTKTANHASRGVAAQSESSKV